jgi:hypothetical protein
VNSKPARRTKSLRDGFKMPGAKIETYREKYVISDIV